jgi:diguanylate cyclase (GGDEF)-like protein
LTWGILILFTLALLAVVVPISSAQPEAGIGSGRLVFVGFLYVIPLYFLFDQSLKVTFLIMCSSWIYTMLVLSFSFRIGNVFPNETSAFSQLIIQTIVYALTLHFFIIFVQNKFIGIIRMMGKTLINRTLVISVLWFFLVVFINYTWVMGSTLYSELFIILLLGCNAFMTYQLFYSLVSLNQRANTLQLQVQLDPLTDLKNRAGLYEDMDRQIKLDQPFFVIFIDLDNFKWVNDTYGHTVGDSYLLHFVREVKENVSDEDYFYRLSGDEFVILYKGEDIYGFGDTLKSIHFYESESGVPFQGLSFGFSAYPVDADEIKDLLHLADEEMYQVKKIKHRLGYSDSFKYPHPPPIAE